MKPDIQNTGKQRKKVRGRPTRPTRSVIQLRVRFNGKVKSYYSVTVDMQPSECMKALQELFGDRRKFQRLTDDPRWYFEKNKKAEAGGSHAR